VARFHCNGEYLIEKFDFDYSNGMLYNITVYKTTAHEVIIFQTLHIGYKLPIIWFLLVPSLAQATNGLSKIK